MAQEAVNKNKTLMVAKQGMLVAISIGLVYLIHFPIFPAVPFLEYDPADIPILIGTFAFGPWAGMLLTAVTSVIQGTTVSAGSGLYGILMHMIATGVLALCAGSAYRIWKSRAGAAAGLVIGTFAMGVVMIGANLIITPLFMGVPRSMVWELMPFIIGFNVLKAGINSLAAFLVYKKISAFLHR